MPSAIRRSVSSSRCDRISLEKSSPARLRCRMWPSCRPPWAARVDILQKEAILEGEMSIRKRADGEYSAHLQGTLDLLIMRTLIFGRQHGQGIARAIQEQSSDVLIVDHGSLYPALQRLEGRGLIDAEWGTSDNNRRARFYTLTRKGKKELVREQSEWRRISAAIARVLGSPVADA